MLLYIIVSYYIFNIIFSIFYHLPLCDLTFRCDVLMCFSATDALKGEGLQEGVDWLQGQ